MSDTSSTDQSSERQRGISSRQKTLLSVAVVLMMLGGVMYAAGAVMGTGGGAGTAQVATSGGDAGDGSGIARGITPSGLVPIDPPGEGESPVPGDAETPSPETDPDLLTTWSPTIFRLGFSFFVGFAIAYALRTFIKVSIIGIGLLLLGLFGLQYVGVIDVDWTAIEGHYDTAVAWLGKETDSFKQFVTGYLPSSATAVFGMVVGFRKK